MGVGIAKYELSNTRMGEKTRRLVNIRGSG